MSSTNDGVDLPFRFRVVEKRIGLHVEGCLQFSSEQKTVTGRGDYARTLEPVEDRMWRTFLDTCFSDPHVKMVRWQTADDQHAFGFEVERTVNMFSSKVMEDVFSSDIAEWLKKESSSIVLHRTCSGQLQSSSGSCGRTSIRQGSIVNGRTVKHPI